MDLLLSIRPLDLQIHHLDRIATMPISPQAPAPATAPAPVIVIAAAE